MGISASSPFELLAHGLVWALDDKDHTDETYVPWVATQLSGAIAVRANLDWGFVELGGSYHRHYEGSGLEWAQPSGAFGMDSQRANIESSMYVPEKVTRAIDCAGEVFVT
jgi:hypothetical protein